MNRKEFESIIKCIADEHKIDKGIFIVNQHCFIESNYYVKYKSSFIWRLEPGDTIDTCSYDDYRFEIWNKRFCRNDIIYYKHLGDIKIFTVAKQYKESE